MASAGADDQRAQLEVILVAVETTIAENFQILTDINDSLSSSQSQNAVIHQGVENSNSSPKQKVCTHFSFR